ncbi:hypothetical protein DFQ27_000322 [Actinomortierella ambigua]|uniref:Suppressor of white apricot N-terminal domain-containing protein n=1 Tax=Actinomortierella ambigua TaxID=1343610 RepID=A0A9P6QE73_9FUNG|nr:hypothetical protein DFQ27_000322 [Actinomortierella ambigua]
MWNDPPLTESRSPPPRRRVDRERGKGKDDKDKDNDLKELTAFGYECFLFRNDEVVAAIEAGQYLIPWQSQDPAHEDTLWLDRYDARNLLDDQRYFTGSRQVHDNALLGEYGLDQERYEDLDSDEEIMFDMDEYEREDHLEEKRSEAYRLDRRGIGFTYDEEPTDFTPFKLHFSVPEGMLTPEDAKSLALIERTAKFINNCAEPTMEATLQLVESKRLPQSEHPMTTKESTELENESLAAREKQPAQTSQENAIEPRIDPSALYINYVEQEESALELPQHDEADINACSGISSSNPDTSATRVWEMKRLERMERIRELLQKKQGPQSPVPPET